MAIDHAWNRIISLFIGGELLFSLFCFVFYPQPAEMITLSAIGLGSFLLLAFIYETWGINQRNDAAGKILQIVFLACIALYLLYILLVIRISWWEGRLVFNILKTERGRAYGIIAALFISAFILHQLYSHIKHRRCPSDEDIDSKKR